jgi:hypothetical protein
MNKLLAASLVALLASANLWAAATQDSRTKTVFSNVVVTGTLEVDGTTTHDGAVTNNGAVTTTGVFNTSASTPYAIKFSSKTAAIPSGTPSATGILAVDNSNLLYISTSTNPGGWQKVGAQ